MAEFNAYKATYNTQIEQAVAFSGQSLDFFTRVKAEYLLELLATALPGDGPLDVLDVGCGHGNIHGFLLASGKPLRLKGVDVAGEVIEEARGAHPQVDYAVYDGVRLPYDDASFDAAYTVCVMHHVPPAQWQSFLAEMRRVVRPGGVVAVFEHNPYNPGAQWIAITCPIDKNAVLLGYGRVKRLARAAGLRDLAGRFILFTPFGSPVFRTLDRRLGWLPMGAQYLVYGRVPAAGAGA